MAYGDLNGQTVDDAPDFEGQTPKLENIVALAEWASKKAGRPWPKHITMSQTSYYALVASMDKAQQYDAERPHRIAAMEVWLDNSLAYGRVTFEWHRSGGCKPKLLDVGISVRAVDVVEELPLRGMEL